MKHDVLRMMLGGVIVLVISLLVFFFRSASPSQQLARKAHQLDLVDQMHLALLVSSQTEKMAVMAVTDEDSHTYAGQAHAAADQVDEARTALEKLIDPGAEAAERDCLRRFADDFARVRAADKPLLDLAVKNTNLKAYRLAYGPAAQAMGDVDAALSRFITRCSAPATPESQTAIVDAAGAQTAALRLQALLPPHIAEAANAQMDQLEARMTELDQQVHHNLDQLAARSPGSGDTDLAAATAAYARFSELRREILALSRENTNVLSLAMSLNEKPRLLMTCEEDLTQLKQLIDAQPVTQPPASPR